MESIATISFELPTVQVKSNRNLLLKELYVLYTSQPEINRKENRKRYHEYVRLHYPTVCRKVGFSKELYDSFKPEFRKAKLPKDKKFISYLSEKVFSIKMAHCDLDCLEIMISKARDCQWRGYCVAQYIMGSIKWTGDKPLA